MIPYRPAVLARALRSLAPSTVAVPPWLSRLAARLLRWVLAQAWPDTAVRVVAGAALAAVGAWGVVTVVRAVGRGGGWRAGGAAAPSGAEPPASWQALFAQAAERERAGDTAAAARLAYLGLLAALFARGWLVRRAGATDDEYLAAAPPPAAEALRRALRPFRLSRYAGRAAVVAHVAETAAFARRLGRRR
jgi:hypothetical protein